MESTPSDVEAILEDLQAYAPAPGPEAKSVILRLLSYLNNESGSEA